MGERGPPEVPRESLEWLSTEKLLELIAHDINNMCHAALSYVDLALDAKQPPEVRTKFLQISKQLVHRASRFAPHLKALNELRAAEAGSLHSEPLGSAADKALAAALELNPGASLKLERTGDAWGRRALGGKFVTDALAHLLDNAVRFAKPGKAAEARADATVEGGMVRLTVADNGRGFQKGAPAYATRRFAEPGSVSGAGLGLAFIRILAERAGGSVEVANTAAGAPAPGAVVTLRLPLAPEP